MTMNPPPPRPQEKGSTTPSAAAAATAASTALPPLRRTSIATLVAIGSTPAPVDLQRRLSTGSQREPTPNASLIGALSSPPARLATPSLRRQIEPTAAE